MIARIISLLCVVGLIANAYAAQVNWVGAANDNAWSSPLNWDTKAVPTIKDDVVINAVGGASVIVGTDNATALSVTLGASGGRFSQTLTLYSSLTIGGGGLLVQALTTLTLSGPNDKPLSTTGTVRIVDGGTLKYVSGDITGSGKYIVEQSGIIIFSGPGLKEIQNTSLIVIGNATVVDANVQFTNNGILNFTGPVSVIGQTSFFASDSTASLLLSTNAFTYQLDSLGSLLRIAVPSSFLNLEIISGIIQFEGLSTVHGTLTVSAQAGLSVQNNATTFNSIQSQGTIKIGSIATVATLTASQATVSSGSSLTITSASSVKSLEINGKLVVNAVLTVSATVLAGGTVAGTSSLQSTDTFLITQLQSVETTSFIYTEVQIAGKGATQQYVSVLFDNVGNLHILPGGSFLVTTKTSFNKQGGTPLITNEGTFTVQIPDEAVFDSNVDFVGVKGVLLFQNGHVIFEDNTLTANKVTILTSLVEFTNSVVQFAQVDGTTGSIYITASSNAASTFSSVSIALFSVYNGAVNVSQLAVNTLGIYNGGILNLGNAFSHTTNAFNFNGGILAGPATLTVSTVLTIAADMTSILKATTVSAKQFKYTPTSTSTLILQDAAKLNIGL